jgi:dienelactone hydrolase
MRAKMIVEQFGYAVFCVDVYGKGIRPQGPEQCAPEMMKYLKDRPLLRARALAGFEELKKLPVVDASKVASIGYCFGGITALELCRTGADVACMVGFHCNLNSTHPEEAKKIRARVLILNGADDPVVPDAETQAFEKEMRATQVDWTLTRYGGVVHSYTQPHVPTTGKEAAYNEKADKRSWIAMSDFFRETFGAQ